MAKAAAGAVIAAEQREIGIVELDHGGRDALLMSVSLRSGRGFAGKPLVRCGSGGGDTVGWWSPRGNLIVAPTKVAVHRRRRHLMIRGKQIARPAMDTGFRRYDVEGFS